MPSEDFNPFAHVKPFLPDDIKFGDRFGVIAYTTAFYKYAEMLWNVDWQKCPTRPQSCQAVIYGLRGDVRALSILIAQGCPNQSYILYRAVIEKLVTFWHLQIASDEVFSDYFQYHLHKTYRKTQKEVRVQSKNGEVGYRTVSTFDLSQFPEMEKAVKRFTSKTGKPLTRWHNDSLTNRIAEVKSTGIIDTVVIELLTEHIYDDASEALHGTLYGCLFELDVFEPRPASKSPAEMEQRLLERLFASSYLGSMCLFQMVEWLTQQSGQKELLEESRTMKAMINDHMESALKKQPPVDNMP